MSKVSGSQKSVVAIVFTVIPTHTDCRLRATVSALGRAPRCLRARAQGSRTLTLCMAFDLCGVCGDDPHVLPSGAQPGDHTSGKTPLPLQVWLCEQDEQKSGGEWRVGAQPHRLAQVTTLVAPRRFSLLCTEAIVFSLREGRERERDMRDQLPLICAPARARTCNPGMLLDWEVNR